MLRRVCVCVCSTYVLRRVGSVMRGQRATTATHRTRRALRRMCRECVKDCREALILDATYTKGHLRLVKALCEVLLSTHSGVLLLEYHSCAYI